MDAQLLIGRIHVIEWLRPGDMKTGRELHGEIEPIGIVSRPQVPVSFREVHSREEFIEHLARIRSDLLHDRRAPLIHIETHGAPDGIGLGEGNEMLWTDLQRKLVPINETCGLRLVVILAACEGIWGIQMAQPVGRAPFLVLLGPNDPIGPGLLAKVMQRFYHRLLVDRDGNQAMRDLNPDRDAPLFSIVNAEQLFRAVFAEFLRTESSEGAEQRRLERVFRAACDRLRQAHGGHGLFAEEKRMIWENLLRVSFDLRQHFEERRRHYFMIDLFPQNEVRFAVSFEDCLAAPE